jgi:hypothetical protein
MYNSNVRSSKKKIELPGLCYSDALIGSNHHFRLLYFCLFDRTVVYLTSSCVNWAFFGMSGPV